MFLDGVFGTEMPFVVKFFLAFLLVLGLIGVGAWGLRRFTSGRLGSASTRGRQPRLGVIDYASVDARRRLILVRRDNVEHLLMIGGPTDVVVEANIVRAVAAPRDVALARPAAAEPLPRAIPLPDNGNGSWPLQPEVITPPPPARQAPKIEPASDDAPAWPPLQPQADTPPAAPARPQRDTLAALADELSARPTPPATRVRPLAPARAPLEARADPRVVEPRPEPRAPTVQSAPTPTPAETAAADQSLAEMAHRLEAALRKPNAPAEARAPAPQPRQTQPAEQAAAPEPAPPSPPQPRAARPAEPKPARSAPPAKPPQSTTLYDNLEQEMASLLGRPTNKS
ncbi:MAG TPA: flagellar biosynthesis protein FliO [Xanthobacteraceae bacterium]|nr:flagellar biosynthesis protein FliO [Xanthobacteraceae bacterium]